MNSELARGRVRKLLLEVAIDLWLNLIVKISILYIEFVLPWGLLGQILSRFLPL